ncbi:hypothetical protein [Pseudomonas phage HU1]|nr:hypothetical protein [Pseudomonas phage HU1]
MTVTTTLDRQYFPGDGSNKNFPFNFKFFDNSQIYVYLIDPAGGVVGKVLNVDYTISGALSPVGGQVVMSVAPALNYQVLIQRKLTITQPTSIRNQGAFFPAIHEDVFDRLTMLVQQAIFEVGNGLQKNAAGLAWDFKGLRGVNAANPINAQDVATKNSVELYVSSILLTGQGPVNNASNVLYVYPDGVTHVVQDLSSPTGVKGIGTPGGNLGDLLDKTLGFQNVAAMAAASIPSTLNYLVTACAQTPGYGGRVFTRYTGSYAADGWCIVQTADGSKWKAVGVPDPQLFGAVNGTDITSAMQRFINYAATRREPEMNWSINGIISSPVVGTVGVGSSDYCRNIKGKLSLAEPAATVAGTLFTMTNFIQTTIGDGEYIGSILYSARKAWGAFKFIGCKYLTGGDFYIVGCVRWGMECTNYTTEFKFGHLKFLYCGSSNSQGVTFSATTHFRTGSVLSQRSNFQVFTPPAGVRSGDGLLINGTYYHIRVIDTSGQTMQVFPALDSVDLANISGAYWIMGGGFRHGDGEANAGYISRLSGLVCAIDCACDDLYPVTIGKAASQVSVVRVRIGVDRDAAYRGGATLDTYTEGTKIDTVVLGQGGDVITGTPYSVGHTGQFTPVVPYQFADYINDDLTKNSLRNTPVLMTDVNKRSVVPRTMQTPVVSTQGGNTEVTVIAVQEVGGGYGKVNQLSLDKARASGNGCYSLSMFFFGASTGNPGTVTLQDASGTGVTVMGEAIHNLVMTGPTMVFAMFINNNWTVYKGAAFVNG